MRSNYKPLGNYISEVNERDTQINVETLLGVSIQKKFIPSIANIIGTDMSTYKIVRKNQFAYGPVTSRNGDKVSIALLESYDEAIVSQAYTVFEISKPAELLPEYLMMWFRRPEFDRYARFMSHGSAREIFGWEEICNTELPIPHIDKQREIVAEYNTILRRIDLNNGLIQKLEETAQAIYKQWFVDFEFPDGNNKTLNDYIILNPKLQIKKSDIVTYVELNDLSTTSMGIEGSIKRKYIGGSKFQNGDTLLARITPSLENGKTAFVDILEDDEVASGSTEFIVMRAKKSVSPYWVYCLAREENFRSYAISSMIGSSGRQRVHDKYLEKYALPEFDDDTMNRFHEVMKPIFSTVQLKRSETQKLVATKDLLLSKLATVEN